MAWTDYAWRGLSLVSLLALGAAVSCSDASGSDVNNGAVVTSGGSGGSSNAGTGGTNLFGGSSSMGGSSIGQGGSSLQGCGADQYTGELIPIDLYILLDKSGSMAGGDGDPDIWGPVTNALSQFLGAVSGDIRLGLGLFPKPAATPPQANKPCASNAECGAYGDCFPGIGCLGTIAFPGESVNSCVSVDYTTPDVAFAPLPGVTSSIQTVINGASPDGSITPTTAALEGTMDYLEAFAAPDRQIVIALATDGEPGPCTPNTVADVAAVAAQGQARDPAILTFVIGLGSLSSLNEIAQAGGTGQAILVDTSNSGTQFLDALNDIRGAVSCQYKIPTPSDGTPNPDLVNVGITPPGGMQDVIPRVANAQACQGQPGWYYDNPAAPNQILLCPSSCDLVENSEGVLVDVAIGCETVVR